MNQAAGGTRLAKGGTMAGAGLGPAPATGATAVAAVAPMLAAGGADEAADAYGCEPGIVEICTSVWGYCC